MGQHIFLTGVTGFVGRNLLPRLLKSTPSSKITVLVRGKSKEEARRRFRQIVLSLENEVNLKDALNRTEVLLGDVTKSQLGLSMKNYDRLTRQITHIIHAAANVSFQLPLQQARLFNVEGTANIIRLAESAQASGRFERLVYLSTAFVCGNRTGTVYESELECGQQFENSYQQSKFEAEQLLNRHKKRLPITIFRPSIIVGHSKTGITSAFNVIYYPLKMLYRGLLKVIPGSPTTSLDVVPIDYVCDAISYISLKTYRGIGKTFHLTSGPDQTCSIRECVDIAVRFFNSQYNKKQIPNPKYVPQFFYYVARFFSFSHTRHFLNKFEQYLPFMVGEKKFDRTNTDRVLNTTPIKAPRLNEYFDRLLQYCLVADWGRNTVIA